MVPIGVKLILVKSLPGCSASSLITHQTSLPPHCQRSLPNCRLCNFIGLCLHITSPVGNLHQPHLLPQPAGLIDTCISENPFQYIRLTLGEHLCVYFHTELTLY